MNTPNDRLCKFMYFCTTIFFFTCIYAIGYFGMYVISYIYDIHPYITLAFYVLLYFIDRFLTIRIMKSQLVIFGFHNLESNCILYNLW